MAGERHRRDLLMEREQGTWRDHVTVVFLSLEHPCLPCSGGTAPSNVSSASLLFHFQSTSAVSNVRLAVVGTGSIKTAKLSRTNQPCTRSISIQIRSQSVVCTTHISSTDHSSYISLASPSKDRLPTLYGPGPFCHSCQTNQMLIVNLLSNYLPAPEVRTPPLSPVIDPRTYPFNRVPNTRLGSKCCPLTASPSTSDTRPSATNVSRKSRNKSVRKNTWPAQRLLADG